MAALRYTGSVAAAVAALGAGVSLARRLPVALTGALILPPAAALVWGVDSAAFPLAGLAPGAVLSWFIYRYNLLGLRISPRLVFAMRLGVVFAFYLLLVKRAADILEDELDAFRNLVELALILAATLVWLPLYGWMNRFLSKRAQVYADFSKRLIEEAARIVPRDPEHRLREVVRAEGEELRLLRDLVGRHGAARDLDHRAHEVLHLHPGLLHDLLGHAVDDRLLVAKLLHVADERNHDLRRDLQPLLRELARGLDDRANPIAGNRHQADRPGADEPQRALVA